jgi:hypothetical protein
LQNGRYVIHKPVAPQKLRQFVNEVLSSETLKEKTASTPSLTGSN